MIMCRFKWRSKPMLEVPKLTEIKLLVICGPSGSGKSYLEKNLCSELPQHFRKLPQVTTRKPRNEEEQGNPYLFINKSTYEFIKDKLIGRIMSDDFLSTNYGTIPDFDKGYINTIILSKEAIIDLQNHIAVKEAPFNGETTVNLFILGLDIEFEDLSREAKAARANRDKNFFDKEKEVFEYCHYINKTENGKYLNPNDILDIILNHRKSLLKF